MGVIWPRIVFERPHSARAASELLSMPDVLPPTADSNQSAETQPVSERLPIQISDIENSLGRDSPYGAPEEIRTPDPQIRSLVYVHRPAMHRCGFGH